MGNLDQSANCLVRSISKKWIDLKTDSKEVEPVVEEKKESKKLEVLCDGYYHDVTEFIDRHPGGDIINLYVESGEDATIAIQQFHYRSLNMVMARMKGLKKRKATNEEGKKINILIMIFIKKNKIGWLINYYIFGLIF